MQKSALPCPALLQDIFQAISAGQLTTEQAMQRVQNDQTVAIDGATVDIGRASRCRFGEVIYGEGKSATLIVAIARTQLEYGQNVLVTRLNQTDAVSVCESFRHSYYHPQARTLRISTTPIQATASSTTDANGKRPFVAVVTAGSTDAPIASEAVQTLAWMNVATFEVNDIGVAGPQRLLAAVPLLRQAAVVVVVAGMEGALPSVIGGHLPCPIIAVPTSVGYGTSFGGITALLGMLSSCAANVTVVGIDAGFKGGYVAGLIATQLETVILASHRVDPDNMANDGAMVSE
jgi:pyridinium-3,5-biscarboxylic acid mononucleotide synthase